MEVGGGDVFRLCCCEAFISPLLSIRCVKIGGVAEDRDGGSSHEFLQPSFCVDGPDALYSMRGSQ